jgi:hypothetical protein
VYVNGESDEGRAAAIAAAPNAGPIGAAELRRPAPAEVEEEEQG